MKFYEKRIFWLIIIFIFIFYVWTSYFYKNTLDISINIIFPLNSTDYWYFIWILATFFLWLFWWLYKLDLQEEKEKHLSYIRTINDRIWKKIDWNFFNNINEARKFCEKNEYYIVPYWYKYNISEIDFNLIYYDDELWESTAKIVDYIWIEDIDLILKKLENEFIWENNISIKEFLEIDSFIEYLDNIKKNKLDINYLWEVLFRNNITSNDIIEYIKKWKDFTIIEWYYYLYKI